MSEFYQRRRIAIKDGTALFAFFLGYVWSGVFAWPFLTAEIDRGNMIGGLGLFLTAVLATGLATGVVGLEAGSAIGSLWERYHRIRRSHPRAVAPAPERGAAPEMPELVPTTASAGVTTPRRARVRVRYASGRIDARQYVALAERVCPGSFDMSRMQDALVRTVNLTAWDTDRLVGIARVMTDGYLRSAVLDLMVDPEYQGQGIGRTLLQHALAATPGERLTICAHPASAGFFEHVGCDRTVTGFTLARAS
jgi:GNAT superfamily N-acetyltransferase